MLESHMPIADLHLHTLHSHGTAHVEAMVQAGLARGVRIFGFTEHSPRPTAYTYPEDDFNARVVAQFPSYIAEVAAAQDAHPGATILLGAEIDFVPGHDAFLEVFVKSAPFAYLLGGVHFIGTWGFDFTPADWDAMTEDAKHDAFHKYYEIVGQLAAWGRCHTIAHFDLPKLFSLESHGRFVASAAGKQAIQTALDGLAATGMALECSTAGLRKPCKEIYPGPSILHWAVERGLRCCPASDAHAPNQVAFQFDALRDYVRRHGVEQWHLPTLSTETPGSLITWAANPV